MTEIVDDENLIIVPVGYPDSIITKEHFTRKGECVVTCNLAVVDVMTKIGQTVSCPDCGKSFKIVRQEEVVPQPEAVAPKQEEVVPQPEAVAPKQEEVVPQPEAVAVQPQGEVVPKRKSPRRKSGAKSRKKSKK